MVFALLWRYLRAAFAFAFFLCVSASQFISPFIILRYKDPANMFQVPVTPQIGGYPLLGPTGLDQVYGETNPGADRSQLTTSTGPATHENIFGDGYGGFTQNESYQPWMSPDTVVYAVRKVYKSGKYGKDLAVYNFQEWESVLHPGRVVLLINPKEMVINGMLQQTYEVMPESKVPIDPGVPKKLNILAVGVVASSIIKTGSSANTAYVTIAYHNCINVTPISERTQNELAKPAGHRFTFSYFRDNRLDAVQIKKKWDGSFKDANDFLPLFDATVVIPWDKTPGGQAFVCLHKPRYYDFKREIPAVPAPASTSGSGPASASGSAAASAFGSAPASASSVAAASAFGSAPASASSVGASSTPGIVQRARTAINGLQSEVALRGAQIRAQEAQLLAQGATIQSLQALLEKQQAEFSRRAQRIADATNASEAQLVEENRILKLAQERLAARNQVLLDQGSAQRNASADVAQPAPSAVAVASEVFDVPNPARAVVLDGAPVSGRQTLGDAEGATGAANADN